VPAVSWGQQARLHAPGRGRGPRGGKIGFRGRLGPTGAQGPAPSVVGGRPLCSSAQRRIGVVPPGGSIGLVPNGGLDPGLYPFHVGSSSRQASKALPTTARHVFLPFTNSRAVLGSLAFNDTYDAIFCRLGSRIASW
jgi:hypothetical protein